MATSLTFHGQDADVAVGDRTITLTGAVATSGPDDRERSTGLADDDPVVLPRSEVAGVTLEPATLLEYGRLAIQTRAGRTHTVRFPRDAQERFDNLEAIIRP
jgi:hypothetical protein